MGHSKASGERRKDFGAVKFVSNPDKSGFLGYYSLNHLGDPFLKRYELELEEFPEEAYWCRIKSRQLNVYGKEMTLGEKTEKKVEKELEKIISRHLTLVVQVGAKSVQYEYKWK
jgi:hypothetical protein